MQLKNIRSTSFHIQWKLATSVLITWFLGACRASYTYMFHLHPRIHLQAHMLGLCSIEFQLYRHKIDQQSDMCLLDYILHPHQENHLQECSLILHNIEIQLCLRKTRHPSYMYRQQQSQGLL